MKRAMVLLAAAAVLLVSVPVFAGEVGNSIQPIRTTTESLGVGAAFEYTYVANRLNDLDNKWGPKNMQVEDFNQLVGKLEVGVYDNYNVYARVGGQNYHLSFIHRAEDATMKISLDNGILAGLGANCLFPFFNVDNMFVGGDLQSDFFCNGVNGITRSGQVASNVDGSFYGVDGQESIYLAYKFEFDSMKTAVVPYFGGYHSWILVGTLDGLSYTTPSTGAVDGKDFQAAFDALGFGVLVGVDIDIAKYVNLNIEGRFIGENALTAGAMVKF